MLMKKIKLFFTAILAFAALASASAQTVTVSGVVLDATTSEAIPGAAVQLKGDATTYALTDVFGNYTIAVPAKGILTVSCLGYTTAEVAVNGKSAIDIKLEPDAQALEGTVFIGYGSAKKVGNIVGQVTTIKGDAVQNAPAVSALDLLQGQVAGMQVMSTGGVAGDNNISMKIHGTGSLGTTSEPLFIVDGIQSSSSAVMAMNPNDILNVTVLKDASSTSIYGALGANGVVYVTTKGGKFDSEATVTVTSQYGISTLANMQFYDNMMSASELKNFWMRSGLMTADQIYSTYTSKGYDADTKWHYYFQRFNNPQYQNDVTIEGGSSKVAYMLGLSQFHQDGNTYGNFYDRYTLRSNIQARPKEWLKVGLNLNGSLTQNTQNGNWGDSSGGANYTFGGISYLNNPLYPAIDPETGKEYDVEYPMGLPNPKYFFDTKYRKDQGDTFRLQGSAYVEVEPVRNLIWTTRVGTDSSYGRGDFYFMPSSHYSDGIGTIQKSSAFASKNTITNTLEYSMLFGDSHSVSLLAGQEYIDYYYARIAAYGEGITDDRLMSLGNFKQDNPNHTLKMSQGREQYRFLSFFGHAEYSFEDKYLLDLTVRNDASSRFGQENRNGFFWAAGAMWKLGREEFMEGADIINDFNIKASYGTQGNAGIGNYRHLGIITTSGAYNGGSGMALAQPENQSLTWENQKLLTIGFDARLLDAIDIEFSVYNRVTSDMLMSVPQPYTSGFTEVYSNVGAMQNSGFDLSLNLDLLHGRDYYMNARFALGYNREKVTELFNGLDRWEIANTGVAFVVGSPVMYYYPISAGIDPEDGAPMWYVPGDDIDVCTMDPNNVTKIFDEDKLTQNTGKMRHEPVNGGFGIDAGYKGLFFKADFSFILGKNLINNDEFFYANPNQFAGDNQNKIVTDFWTPYHTDARFPDWSKGYTRQTDSSLLQDASFLRLKTLVLGYRLPKKLLANQNVFKSVSFTLTGRNLLTFTNYEGMDPEVDSNLTLGIPGNTLQVLGGIELKF